MKRIMGALCGALLCMKSAYAMEQKLIDLNTKEAKLFGTIKDWLECCEVDEPIVLKNIGNVTMRQLMEDLPWVLSIHAKYAQGDVGQILKMSDEERIQRAMRATRLLKMPDYSAQILHKNISNLKGADYLEAPELGEAYAKIVAMLSVSDESLRALHEQSEGHPMLEMSTTLSDRMRNTIYRYMPQIWGERLKIKCDDSFWSVGFSPDSSMVVTRTNLNEQRNLVQIRDVKTGDIIREIQDGKDPVIFSPNNRFVVIPGCGQSYISKIVDIKTGVEHSIRHYELITSVDFSQDSKLLAIAFKDGRVKVIAMEAVQKLYEQGHAPWNWTVVHFSPDNTKLVSASYDNAKILDAKSGEVLGVIEHEKDRFDAAIFSPNSRLVATTSTYAVTITDINTGDVAKIIPNTPEGEKVKAAVIFSSDSKWAAITYERSGTVFIMNWENRSNVQMNFVDHCNVTGITFSSNDVVITNANGWIAVHELNSGTFEELDQFKHDDNIKRVAFSSDKNMAMTISGNDSAKIIDLQRGEMLDGIKHDSKIRIGRFSPDDSMAVTACEESARVTERLASTFDQALLVQYLRWCKNNNQRAHYNKWVADILNTYADTSTLEKTFPGV